MTGSPGDMGQPTPPRDAARVWIAVHYLVGVAISSLILVARFNPTYRLAAVMAAALLLAWIIATWMPITRRFASLPVVLVIGPLLVRHHRIRSPGEVCRVEGLPEDLGPGAIDQFTTYRAGLEREGFRSGGVFRLSGFYCTSPGRQAEVMFIEGFEHSVRRHGAVVAICVPRPRKAAKPFLRFCEIFDDGRLVATMNADGPSMFPRLPEQRGISLPRITEARELYAVHRGVLQRFAPGHACRGPAPDGWEAAILRENILTVAAWRRHGFITEAGIPDEFRLSRWMLIRAAWGQTKPFREIRRWLARRRCERDRIAWGV